MKKKKWVIIVGGIVILLLVVVSQIKIFTNYYYSSVTFPKGNISEDTDLSYTDFKRPLGIEGIKWDKKGNRRFYLFSTDEEKIKDIIKQFDQAVNLDDFDNDKFLADLPEDKGARHVINLIQLEYVDGVPIRGEAVLSFTFYENHDILKLTNTNFYKLEYGFKEDLL